MCNTFKKHLQMRLFLAKIYNFIIIIIIVLNSWEIPRYIFPLNSYLQPVCFNVQQYLWTEMQLINTNIVLFDPK